MKRSPILQRKMEESIPGISVSAPGDVDMVSEVTSSICNLNESLDTRPQQDIAGVNWENANMLASVALSEQQLFSPCSGTPVTVIATIINQLESRSGREGDSSSREGSLERQSVYEAMSDSVVLNTLLAKSVNDDDLNDVPEKLGKNTSQDMMTSPGLPLSRTASFSNISNTSNGSTSNIVMGNNYPPISGKETQRKSPILKPNLVPNYRHNSDASSVASSTGKSARSSDRKRQRWYQSLYPSYKQRSEEFKKLFPTVAESGERLLIDYSCALQRDILVQGRLYVSQYHICFYAKIIAWETNICTPWKTVSALSKERTAKIIPNALSYTTDHDQYYFTSFGQRDKSFTNLYRIWQGAVKDQPMSTQEMWSFIHYQYGDDLGPLSSDDEDYVQPAYLRSYKEVLAAVIGTEEDDQRLAEDHAKFPVDSLVDSTSLMINTESALERPLKQIVIDNPANDVNADVSSSSGSDHGDEAIYIPAPPVNGQTFIDHEFRIPFDQLFLVMFSESKLLKDMFVRRKFLEAACGQWTLDPTTDCQVRHVKYCISIGPKTIRTEERQTLLKESLPGRLHLVDSVAQNHGAPYSDSFSVVTHYVLHKVSTTATRLRVATEVVFRKANWAVKAILEKGVMDQLRDYMADLKGRLSTFEAELATQDPEESAVMQEPARKETRRLTPSRHDGHTLSRSAGGLPERRRSISRADVDFDRSGNRLGHLYEARSENDTVRKMVYLIFILLLVNLTLYLHVWEYWSPSGSDSCGDRCSNKRADWLTLVSRLAQPENTPLLQSVSEGLELIVNGMRMITSALEEIQTNISAENNGKNDHFVKEKFL